MGRCVNAYDTITQADGVALPNEFPIPPIPLETGGYLQSIITSYCRTADGTWIGWVQNDPGDGIEDDFSGGAYGPDQNKDNWPALVASATPIGVGFFPDDGSAPVVYNLGLDWPVFHWNSIPVYGDANHCSRLFVVGGNYADNQKSQMTSWETGVIDVQVRTDGSNVWVVVLARETVNYPYIFGRDDTDRCGAFHPSIQTVLIGEGGDPFRHDTGDGTHGNGYRWWQHYSGSQHDDAGPVNSFRWSPARVTVFAGDLGGFTKLDTVDAQFANDDDFGLCSGIECATAVAEPGVLHVLWAEGGWQSSFRTLYGQRINYSRWDLSGKTLDTDLLRSAAEANTGDYSISDGNWVWTAEMVLRNDHGSPVAIVWPWVMNDGPRYVSPVAQFWDLSGPATVLQTADIGLFPTEAELGAFSPGVYGNLTNAIPGVYGNLTNAISVGLPTRRSQFASSLYTDPLLMNTDVYLLCVACYGTSGKALYRIPCDGSATFDFLDGTREVMYSIIPDGAFENFVFGSFAADFVSDPDNIWMPAGNPNVGGAILQLDRQCKRGWNLLSAFPIPEPAIGYETAGWVTPLTGVSPPSLITDDAGDWIAGGGNSPIPRLSSDSVPIAAIRAKICRCCAPCQQRIGLHIWEQH